MDFMFCGQKGDENVFQVICLFLILNVQKFKMIGIQVLWVGIFIIFNFYYIWGYDSVGFSYMSL